MLCTSICYSRSFAQRLSPLFNLSVKILVSFYFPRRILWYLNWYPVGVRSWKVYDSEQRSATSKRQENASNASKPGRRTTKKMLEETGLKISKNPPKIMLWKLKLMRRVEVTRKAGVGDSSCSQVIYTISQLLKLISHLSFSYHKYVCALLNLLILIYEYI